MQPTLRDCSAVRRHERSHAADHRKLGCKIAPGQRSLACAGPNHISQESSRQQAISCRPHASNNTQGRKGQEHQGFFRRPRPQRTRHNHGFPACTRSEADGGASGIPLYSLARAVVPSATEHHKLFIRRRDEPVWSHLSQTTQRCSRDGARAKAIFQPLVCQLMCTFWPAFIPHGPQELSRIICSSFTPLCPKIITNK